MSPGIKETNGLSLPEAYKANLEQHIEKGDWSLVCRDEELFRHVEDILRGQSAHESCLTLGLDVLSVMEVSLRCLATARAGLQGLSKAFEVLELASLNLYLYPWRKEYRIIKTYSGMFTHHIKPALSMVQVKDLFGLLNYRISVGSSGHEEELCLGTSATPADTLLRLACSFFTARCECQLLVSSLATLSPLAQGPEWELRLVQERRRGHSLQVALQSIQRSLRASVRDPTDVEEDLYMAEEDGGPSSPGAAAGMPVQPQGSHPPLKETHSSPTLGTSMTSSQTPRLCVSELRYRISSPSSPGGGARLEPPRLVEESTFQITGNSTPGVTQKPQESCSCLKFGKQPNYLCQQCNILHCIPCAVLDCCRDIKHNVSLSSDAPVPEAAETQVKQVKLISPKDKRSPLPFGTRGPPGFSERHSCLKARDNPHVTCHTCRRAHDYLCEDGQRCAQANHTIEYQLKPSDSMPFHQCCTSAHSSPQFACLTCRVFHSGTCPDGTPCKRTHSVRELRGVCEFGDCLQAAPQILCRHCCAQFCRECWYKSPLTCLCGKPFDVCSSV